MQRIITVLVTVIATLGSAVSLTRGDPYTHLPDSGDPIAFRISVMKDIGDNAKALKTKLDAGRFGEAHVNAQAIARHATRIPELFPTGSTSDQSRAKDGIWHTWGTFVQSAQTLHDEADQLAQTIATGQVDTASMQARRVFRTCKGCHDRFREPAP